jgi:hypothetical protein
MTSRIESTSAEEPFSCLLELRRTPSVICRQRGDGRQPCHHVTDTYSQSGSTRSTPALTRDWRFLGAQRWWIAHNSEDLIPGRHHPTTFIKLCLSVCVAQTVGLETETEPTQTRVDVQFSLFFHARIAFPPRWPTIGSGGAVNIGLMLQPMISPIGMSFEKTG